MDLARESKQVRHKIENAGRLLIAVPGLHDGSIGCNRCAYLRTRRLARIVNFRNRPLEFIDLGLEVRSRAAGPSNKLENTAKGLAPRPIEIELTLYLINR